MSLDPELVTNEPKLATKKHVTKKPESGSRYKCPLCGLGFAEKRNLDRHTAKKKSTCLSQERCTEIVEELQKKEEKIQRLEEIVSIYSGAEELKQTIVHMGGDIKDIKDKIDEKQLVPSILNQMNNFTNTNNNNDTKMLFAIQFTEKGKETLSHISPEQTLQILNHDEFDNSLKHMTKAVFFHPLAPQNSRWCIIDKNAKFGALEYSHESNTIIRKSTSDVIEMNMTDLVFNVSDFFDDFQKRTKLTKTQERNCNRFIDLVGNELTSAQVTSVKNLAYDERNYPRALWDNLQISVEALPVAACHIRTKII